MKNNLILRPILFVGFLLWSASSLFGQGRLPTLYVSLDRSEETLLDLQKLAMSLNLDQEEDIDRDYLGEIKNHLAKVQAQKAIVNQLLDHTDNLPDNAIVRKLERLIGLNNEIPEIRQWNMSLVNYAPDESVKVLNNATSARFKDRKVSKKVKKMARLLNKARTSTNNTSLNIPLIKRDSIREMNQLVSEAQDFLVEFEEIVRIREEEAKKKRVLDAESYFELFCNELKNMMQDDEEKELNTLLAILRDFENISDPEDAFSPDGFSTRFNGKVSTNQSFQTGRSKLLEGAETRLQLWLRDQVVPKIERRYKVKGEGPIIITINVSGYADMQPFRRDQTVDTRKRLNKNLSYRRAKSISDLFDAEFKILQVEFPYIEWDITTEGKGEELPPGVDPSDNRINNPDRRVCLFSGSIL
ncbi:MAG: hypothetical protein AAF502_13785 [Bacteroidota bacterium]